MFTSKKFVAHLTLRPLLLVSAVIGVGPAASNDQNALWATHEEIGAAMAKRQLGLGFNVKADSFRGIVCKKTKTHERIHIKERNCRVLLQNDLSSSLHGHG